MYRALEQRSRGGITAKILYDVTHSSAYHMTASSIFIIAAIAHLLAAPPPQIATYSNTGIQFVTLETPVFTIPYGS